MEIGLDVCRPTSLFLFFEQSRGEERASGAGEGGREGGRITTVFPEVINKRISQSFSLSHFWPMGTAYMSVLTGGDSNY